MTDLIRNKLDATRRRHLSFAAGTGASMGVCAFVAGLVVSMSLDWSLELPTWARAGLLSINLALVAYLLVRHAILPVWSAPDDDEVALWVEARSPQLNSRLIAAVQLARPGALTAGSAVSLVRETIRQAHKLAESIDFTAVVRPDRLKRWGVAAAVAVLFSIALLALGGRPVVALLGRALLVPGIEVPRRTRVERLTPDPLIAARGDPVTIRARAVGAIPADGRLDASFAGASGTSSQRYALAPDAGKPGEFALTIENLQASFDYTIRLNDGHSPRARVEAVDRPAAVNVRCVQTYPAYAKLADQARAPGDLTLLAGSRLTIHVVANKPAKRDLTTGIAEPGAGPTNRIHLVGAPDAERDILLVPDIAHRTQLVTLDQRTDSSAFELPAGVNGFSVHLTDEHGFTTKDPVVYRIDVVPDKPPTVRVTAPARREDLVTRRATIDVGIDASDDYGLAKLAIAYKIVATTEEEERRPGASPADEETVTTILEHHGRIPLEIAANAREFRGSHQLRIDRLTPPVVEGQTVEWWIEVEDANDLTGPGKSSGEHYIAKVVTDAEKRADLLSRLGNYLGQIDELSESQRQASDDLGTALHGAQATQPANARPPDR